MGGSTKGNFDLAITVLVCRFVLQLEKEALGDVVTVRPADADSGNALELVLIARRRQGRRQAGDRADERMGSLMGSLLTLRLIEEPTK